MRNTWFIGIIGVLVVIQIIAVLQNTRNEQNSSSNANGTVNEQVSYKTVNAVPAHNMECEEEYEQLCEEKKRLLKTSLHIMEQERAIRETQEKMAEELRTIDHEIREAGKKYTDSCSFEDIQSGKYHTAKAQYDALVNGKPKIAIAQQEVIRELQNGVERQKMSYNADADRWNLKLQNYFIRYGSSAKSEGLEPLTKHSVTLH